MTATFPTHCDCCPRVVNLQKQLAVAVGALHDIGSTEAKQALRSVAVLAEQQEQPVGEVAK